VKVTALAGIVPDGYGLMGFSKVVVRDSGT
jgi:hypothetical protein